MLVNSIKSLRLQSTSRPVPNEQSETPQTLLGRGGSDLPPGTPQRQTGPTHLPILLKVVVQHLRMRLLVRRQDMQERGWSVTRGSTRVQGPSRPERRGQAERRRRASVESLLVKRLHGRRGGQCQGPL